MYTELVPSRKMHKMRLLKADAFNGANLDGMRSVSAELGPDQLVVAFFPDRTLTFRGGIRVPEIRSAKWALLNTGIENEFRP